MLTQPFKEEKRPCGDNNLMLCLLCPALLGAEAQGVVGVGGDRTRMWRLLVVSCLMALLFPLVACGYKVCEHVDPRTRCSLGPFVRPARHLVLPKGEQELLVYDCLAFDGSDYWLVGEPGIPTCVEFYRVTCDLPAHELIDYYRRNLEKRGWTEEERATVIGDEVQVLLFLKVDHDLALVEYDLMIHHYTYEGVEMFSLSRSPCGYDWENVNGD